MAEIDSVGLPMGEIEASAPRTKILLASRAPGEFHSIELLFDAVARALPSGVEGRRASAPRRGAGLRSLCSNLGWAAGLKDADLIHITGDIHYAILALWRYPAVLTIHDLRFIEEARGLKRFLFWWLWLYLPCLRAKRVTVISEFTKSRLFTLCPVKPAKVHVIPNCVGPEFTSQVKVWPARKPRLLQVGTTHNKNLSRVIEACAGLPVQLCILGKLTPAQREELDRRGVDYASVSDLTKNQVVALYAECDLVVFVSTYEGFGLPILEGQAVGRPVLTSDLSPMREVAGGGALLVNPNDTQAIRVGLLRLIDDSALRRELVDQGFRNVARYSARAIAQQYAEVYREVLAR